MVRKEVHVELVPKETIESLSKENIAAASCLKDAVKYKEPVFFKWHGFLGVCDKSQVKIV